ncbi:histidine kinase [Thermaurantimonas aggregans]|uniref:Histidine kinase n=1 Tax=Thermaurantimonas aggregans TaxID=2173829 RepID=A0A401XHR9_9FLAO|nr:histidine kinase [Thermaurantimonas aggregans]GCD76553.1 histidine kinase [Thermaurantimonas aggregans]
MRSKFPYLVALILSLLAVFSANELIGQDLLVNEINVFEGISNVPIYTIQTDEKGFIYLSTEKGIIRYNGITFTKFDLEGANNESFNYVYKLSDGRILAINFYEGIFELKNDKFEKKNIFGIKDYKYTFFSVTELNKKIYLLTDIALFVLDKEFQIIKILDNENKEFNIKYFSHMEKFGDTIYVFPKGKNLLKIDKFGNFYKDSLPFDCRWTANVMRDQLFFTCRDFPSAIYKRKNGVNQKIYDVIFKEEITTYKIKNINDEFYFCTSKGLAKINKKTNKLEWIIRNKRTNDLTIDYEGNYWAITLDGELLNWNDFNIRKIQTKLEENITNSIKIDSTRIVIATSLNNFYLFDLKTKSLKHIGQFGKDGVKFLYYDKALNKLYFQFGSIDLATGKYDNFYSGNYIAKGPDGDMIFCISNKIYVFSSSQKDSTYKYQPDMGGYLKQIYESRSYKSVFIDSAAYILLFNGIIKYYNGNITFVKDLLTGKSIIGYDMVIDSEKNLWVANLDKGIEVYRYEFLKKTFDMQNYFTKGSSILRLKYNKPYILVLYQEGLVMIHEKTHEIIDVNSILGKFSKVMNDALYTNDTLYIFTKDEIIYCTLINNKNARAKIFINGITDVNSNFYPFENNRETKLSSKTIFLNYDFLCYSNQGGIKIAYRIKNLDTSWNFISADVNKIFFPYLIPGKHTIQLAAVNSTGKIISDVQVVTVIAPQSFFLTPLFFIIVIVVLIGLLVIAYYLNDAKTKKKELLNNQLRMSKLTALRSRMNPHFVYNILNSIQSLIYIGDKKTASSSLSKFSELMRLVLDLSDKENISLVDEVHVIELYLELEKLRFGDEFKFTIDFDNELKYLNPEIPGFFIQPFVENAIKHGLLHKNGEKRLLLKIEKGTNNDIRIIVDDNGIGRKKSAEINARRNVKKSSFAVEAIINRINLINSQLKRKIVLQIFDKVDLNNEPSGTTVIISIPVELELDT